MRVKKIINYEKDIQFKTAIGEMCSISLEHDFTVDDGVLKGEFIVSGEYKPNALSLNKEPFAYHLPLEYELEKTCDIETLQYDIDNFEYNVNDDTLEVYIDFKVKYDEREITPNIPEITEDDLNTDEFETLESNRNQEIEPFDEVNEKTTDFIKDEGIKEEMQEEMVIEKSDDEMEANISEERLNDSEKEIIIDSALDSDDYIIYHVHIVREGETLESIASKYGTTVEVIKEYNSVESLELKSKLIIPSCKDE